MEIRVESRQGKGGKWRWFMEECVTVPGFAEGYVFKGMSSIRGFDTQIASDTDAMEVMGAMVFFVNDDLDSGAQMFAAGRLFHK